MALSVSTGPLGVSSTYSGPKLNVLEMQNADRQTRNPEKSKSSTEQ